MSSLPLKVLIARFPFMNQEAPSCSDWVTDTYFKAKNDPRIGAVHRVRVDDTPITMGRNRVLKACLEQKIDLLLMVDADMDPDLKLPGAKPFWDSSLDFVLSHEGPCAVAAPYCGPPPHENVYVFHWTRQQNDNPNVDLTLSQYSREHAMLMAGIQEAAALPTGVFLLDTRALKVKGFKAPWFDYEWADEPYRTKKASTEDVFFTRNLSLAGVPVYCNWDAWAGHHKRKCVGKPVALTVDSVREQFIEAVRSGVCEGDRLVMVTPDGVGSGG
jgi:hypothetical protein